MRKTGRPPSLETWRRRLAKARQDLTWALKLPHPYAGRQAQRIRTLEYKIVTIKAKLVALEQEQHPDEREPTDRR